MYLSFTSYGLGHLFPKQNQMGNKQEKSVGEIQIVGEGLSNLDILQLDGHRHDSISIVIMTDVSSQSEMQKIINALVVSKTCLPE